MKTIFLQFTEEVTDGEFAVIRDQLNDVDPDLEIILLPHNIEPEVYAEPLTKLEEFAKDIAGALIIERRLLDGFMESITKSVEDGNNSKLNDESFPDLIARHAFEHAKSMLKEAEKRQS